MKLLLLIAICCFGSILWAVVAISRSIGKAGREQAVDETPTSAQSATPFASFPWAVFDSAAPLHAASVANAERQGPSVTLAPADGRQRSSLSIEGLDTYRSFSRAAQAQPIVDTPPAPVAEVPAAPVVNPVRRVRTPAAPSAVPVPAVSGLHLVDVPAAAVSAKTGTPDTSSVVVVPARKGPKTSRPADPATERLDWAYFRKDLGDLTDPYQPGQTRADGTTGPL